VLIMAVLGPVLAANSEKIGGMILRTGRSGKRPTKGAAKRDPMLDEEIALVEAATADLDPDARSDDTKSAIDRVVEQAMQQQDTTGDRKRD
jgi:CPA2 family monovalent cation:H+ antiporter-2